MRLKYPKFEDHIKNVCNHCGNSYLVLEKKELRYYRIAKNEGVELPLPGGVGLKVIPASCKSWACKFCGKKKVNDLLKRMKVKDLKGYRFFTLTLKNGYTLKNTEYNFDRIGKCFHKLNNKLKRGKRFKDFQFFKIIETGSGGMVHIHGIWNIYIPVIELSAMWTKITGDSYKVHLARIGSTKELTDYLFKYLTKNTVEYYGNSDPGLFSLNIHFAPKLFYENNKRRHTSSRKFFEGIPEMIKDFLPYGFGDEGTGGVEAALSFFYKVVGLKKEQFDLTNYFGSDQFVDLLFDSS